jgi:hypothetical protein
MFSSRCVVLLQIRMTSSNHAGTTTLSHENLGQSLTARAATSLRLLIVLAMAVVAVFYVVRSIHWHMMVDSTVIRYVNFLIDHGRRPYVDISDNNMPGAYYTDFLAMHVFGAGDLGWRIYEYFLLAMMAVAMVVIAKPYDWLAGVFGAGLFLIVHAAEGPTMAVEREEVILVLLLVAYAAMFSAVRRRMPVLMAVTGLACGVAASIKPTFLPLPIALLLTAAFVLRKRDISWMAYVMWAVAGLLAIAALDAGYLLHYRAWHGFLFVMFKITPAYASFQRLGLLHMVSRVLTLDMLLLVLLAMAAGIANRRSRAPWTWEQWSVAMGVGFGLLSFFVQGKGFEHHRYTYLVLLFLLMSFELLSALRQAGLPRAVAMLTILVLLLGILPFHMLQLGRQKQGDNELPDAMESDLQNLGGTSALQDKVQCFDLVFGCLGTLYRLDIVENTGFTGDLMFFSKTDTFAVEYYRRWFWEQARKDPATVLVMSNENLLDRNSFDKVLRWPAFASYLAQNYTLVVTRKFRPHADSYRIYIRNGTPMLARAETMSATWSRMHPGQEPLRPQDR